MELSNKKQLDQLEAVLSIPQIGVAGGVTNIYQSFKLIFKSDKALKNSEEQFKESIKQYKRLRDAVFENAQKPIKPITAVNSGGHWSYVEPVD